MRIARLALRAYGPFERRILDFPATPGLHLIYGPNEAGKSTTLRALGALLFGMPERTADAHRFKYEELRVGAVLERASGERLAFMRRKARTRQSLYEMDAGSCEELPAPFAETRLAEVLGGLDESIFTSMFALDHDRLVEGGHMLAQGKGEVGQTLFEAGAGLMQVRALRNALEAEAAELFRPRASSTALQKATHAFEAARRTAREASVRSGEWQTRERALEGAHARHEQALAAQQALQVRAQRLTRLAAVLPMVAEREHVLAQLALLADAPLLAPDAAQARSAAQGSRADAERLRARAQEEAVAGEAALASLATAGRRDTKVLAEAAAIEALYHGRDDYRDARLELLRQTQRLADAQREAARLAVSLGERAIEGPLSTTLRARVTGLLAQRVKTEERFEARSRELAAATQQRERLRAQLEASGGERDLDELAAVLEAVSAGGDPELRARELRSDLVQREAVLERRAQRLASRPAAALATVGAPRVADAQALEAALREAQAQLAEEARAIAGVEDDLAAVVGQREALERHQPLPPRDWLARLRAERDALWRRYREGGAAAIPPAEIERAIEAADSAADALLGAAEKIAARAELLAREGQMRSALATRRERLRVLQERVERASADWRDLFASHGLPEIGVHEALAWLAEHAHLADDYAAWQRERGTQAAIEEQALTVRARLTAAFADASLPAVAEDESLAEALSRARAAAKAAERDVGLRAGLAGQLAEVEARIRDAERDVSEARAAHERWAEEWQKAMSALALDAGALPEEAQVRLHELEQLEGARADVRAAKTAVAQCHAQIERYEAELARLLAALGEVEGSPAASGTSSDPSQPAFADRRAAVAAPTMQAATHTEIDAAVGALYTRLRESRDREAERRRLEESLRQARARVDEAQAARVRADQLLARLVADARCSDEDALPEAEARSTQRRRLGEDLARLEAQLVNAAAMPLDAVLEQARAQDSARVEAELAQVKDELASAAQTVSTAHQALIEAQQALARIDGSSVAAAAEQEAAGHAARIAALSDRYLAARLATLVLARVVDDYQQRHQGPIVARASEIYAAMTGGRYPSVAVDFDGDEQVLIAMQHDGQRKPLAALSTGRRDQLFLALRLAALETQMARREPMPLVLDDILIQFDDEAAAATLGVLAELAARTQVLYFTHHQHLLDVAVRAIDASRFVAHRL